MGKTNEPLKPYQERAITKIVSNGGSALICHPMGSGKTRTSVEAVERLRAQGKATTTIAVVPASLRTNYLDGGVKKWSNRKGLILGSVSEDNPDIYSKHLPKSDYYIVSYDMFKKDPDLYIDRTKADTIVVDEMHNFRNDSTKNYTQMKSVRSRVNNFIGLTGTPFNNTPDDIRPLVDIVSNGKHDLGHSKGEFAHRYLVKDGDSVSIRNKGRLRDAMNKWVDYTTLAQVQAETAVPKKEVQTVDVEMSPEQKKQYDFVMKRVPKDVREKIRQGMPVNRKEAFHILPMLIQARCVSNSLGYLDDSVDSVKSAVMTPKTRRALEDVQAHLSENPRGQVIVHSHLVEAGTNPVSAGLEALGIKHGVITGKSTKEERDKAVNDYNKGKSKVIVLSSAGTTGLNLPNTTFHVALDGHYNPAVIDQIEARGIRQNGQSYIDDPKKRKVIVRRYKSVVPPTLMNRWGITKRDKSVDEWIYDLANNKNDINAQAESLLKTSSVEDYLTLDEFLYESADFHDTVLQKEAAMKVLGTNSTMKGFMPDNMLNFSKERQQEIARNMKGSGYNRNREHVRLREEVESILHDRAIELIGSDNVKVKHPLYFTVNGTGEYKAKSGFVDREIDDALLSKSTYIPGDSFKYVTVSKGAIDKAGLRKELRTRKDISYEINRLKKEHPYLQSDKKSYIEGHVWVPWKVYGKKIIEDK